MNTRVVMERLQISAPAAGTALETLERAGVLRQSSIGHRNRVRQSDRVLRQLDEFAERIRRATPRRT